MNRLWMAVTAMAAAATVGAQSSTVLYAPVRLIKDQKITLKGWGSGTASETDEAAFEGTHSIRVSTRNLFQGVILGLGNTVDLNPTYSDKNNLLKLTFMVAGSSSMGFGGSGSEGKGLGSGPMGAAMGGSRGAGGTGRTGGGFPGGMPGAGIPGGMPSGAGMRGGSQRGAGTGMPGGSGFPGGAGFPGGRGMGGGSSTASALKTMRVIVTTTDGKRSEAYIPVNTNTSTERGWKTVAVPLQAIRGFDRTNKIVKEVAFSGDATTTFYIGDIRVVNDSTPIRAQIDVRELNLALGDSYTFSASASGGASILKYSWDFDAKDGIQVDAEGATVTRRFRKPGKFVVTLTVTDLYGLKPSYSTTIDVTVNP